MIFHSSMANLTLGQQHCKSGERRVLDALADLYELDKQIEGKYQLKGH